MAGGLEIKRLENDPAGPTRKWDLSRSLSPNIPQEPAITPEARSPEEALAPLQRHSALAPRGAGYNEPVPTTTPQVPTHQSLPSTFCLGVFVFLLHNVLLHEIGTRERTVAKNVRELLHTYLDRAIAHHQPARAALTSHHQHEA